MILKKLYLCAMKKIKKIVLTTVCVQSLFTQYVAESPNIYGFVQF